MVLGSGSGDEGSGGMMRVAIQMAVFVAVFSLLLGYAAPLLNSSSAIEIKGPTSFDIGTIAQNDFAETDDGGYSYTIKPSDYGTYFNPPYQDIIGDDHNFGPTDANKTIRFHMNDFYVHFVPIKDYDESGDAFYFVSNSGWWDLKYVIFRESDIINRVNSVTDRAVLTASLAESVNVYFQFTDEWSPTDSLNYRFSYNVSVGQSYLNQSQDQANVLNVLFGLLTFHLPGGGTGFALFDIMLSTAFIASCSFILYWAITRLW